MKKILGMIFFSLLALCCVLSLIAWLILSLPVFGAHPTGMRLQRIMASPNYRDGVLHNLSPTEVMLKSASYSEMIRDFFFRKPADIMPLHPLPSVRTNLQTLPDSTPTIVWFGHSSYMIAYRGKRILVDPVFSGFASPLPRLGVGKAFPGTNVYGVQDMPAIDMLIITHDHYDHLDYETLTRLAPQCKHIYTSLGVGAHLEHWGIPSTMITEFDWWESHHVDPNILPAARLTALPARHFSGRGILRGKTLWSAFRLELDGYNIFIGGDSGYDTHFSMIGEKCGPFDVALIESGQYGKNWPLIHDTPEEAIRATRDIGAHITIPVHWGKFALATHPWHEPIRRFLAEAQRSNQAVVTARIGEPIPIRKHTTPPSFAMPSDRWWEQ